MQLTPAASIFSVNPCYDLQPAGEDVEQLWAEKNYAAPLVNMDPQRQALYETCQRLGVGITWGQGAQWPQYMQCPCQLIRGRAAKAAA